MNIIHKTEFRICEANPRYAEVFVSVIVDNELFDEVQILKGPIAEVRAYYLGEISSIEDVIKIWNTKDKKYFGRGFNHFDSDDPEDVDEMVWAAGLYSKFRSQIKAVRLI